MQGQLSFLDYLDSYLPEEGTEEQDLHQDQDQE